MTRISLNAVVKGNNVTVQPKGSVATAATTNLLDHFGLALPKLIDHSAAPVWQSSKGIANFAVDAHWTLSGRSVDATVDATVDTTEMLAAVATCDGAN